MRKFFFSPRGELESLGVRAWTSQKKKSESENAKVCHWLEKGCKRADWKLRNRRKRLGNTRVQSTFAQA